MVRTEGKERRRGVMSRLCTIGTGAIAGLLVIAPAFAQEISPSETLDPAVQLPEDMQPEQLTVPGVQYVSPKLARQERAANRNNWGAATLTQSTGLSVMNSQDSPGEDISVDTDPVGHGVLGTDLMSAEDLLNVGRIEIPEFEAATAVPQRKDGVISLSSSLRGALFDLPGDKNVNASVFKLDLGDRLCLGTADECEANEIRKIDIGYAKNITHGKFDGLNLQLTPRAGVRFDEDSKSIMVGALVRIGDNLREGAEMKSNTWYLFAGAEAEAMTFTPTGVRRLTSGEFHLQDRIIIGDAQAGLGYRLGDADLALTYYKRKANAENYSYNENAAALSLTWKR